MRQRQPRLPLWILAAFTLTLSLLTPAARAERINGADLSMLQYLEDHGVTYRDAGRAQDPLLIFKNHSCNYIRLRLFVDPSGKDGQINTLAYTLKLAQRVHAAGLKWLLDFHYSDAWADPLHQTTPAAWAKLNHAQLTDHVFTYTRDTLAEFVKNNCAPDMVAIGNEITNGMLWPDAGPLWIEPAANAATQKSTRDQPKWNNLADLLKAGIRGVRAVDPETKIRIMIHIDKGHSQAVSQDFFDHLRRHDVPFDIIGLSYYPFWNGPLTDLQSNLQNIATRYHKPIIIAETAYDTYGGPQGALPFPLTPAGQRDFLTELYRITTATPDGLGVFYWAPEWIRGDQWNAPTWSGQWENRALFDPTGTPRPAMNVWK